LSWSLILRKRENFRAAFDQFDPNKIAAINSANRTALAIPASSAIA